MYVGRTRLSLPDIRAWNSVHEASEYELHRLDCRHYVNAVVRYTTGLERATTSALRHQWHKNRRRYGLANGVVRLGQYVTDVTNWERVRGAGQAAAAALMALAGQRTLACWRPVPLLHAVQRRLLPVARTGLVPVSRAIAQRPAYAVGGTAAVATLAAAGGQAPAVARETMTVGARMAGRRAGCCACRRQPGGACGSQRGDGHAADDGHGGGTSNRNCGCGNPAGVQYHGTQA